jgi:hypothetical protein
MTDHADAHRRDPETDRASAARRTPGQPCPYWQPGVPERCARVDRCAVARPARGPHRMRRGMLSRAADFFMWVAVTGTGGFPTLWVRWHVATVVTRSRGERVG